MKKITAVIGMSALLASVLTHAGTSTGKVTSMYVHGPNSSYSTSSQGVLMFQTSKPQTGQPGCSNQNEWAVSLDTELGRAIQDTLATAMQTGKSVTVVGTGRCNDWSDREKPKYVNLWDWSLRGTGGDTARLDMAWEPVPGADSYQIFVQMAAGCLVLVADPVTWSLKSPSYDIPGGATSSYSANTVGYCRGSTYQMRIRYKTGTTYSEWSGWSYYTIP